MDPAASAEACKAAESATNIALVRSCTSVAVLLQMCTPISHCASAGIALLLPNSTAG